MNEIEQMIRDKIASNLKAELPHFNVSYKGMSLDGPACDPVPVEEPPSARPPSDGWDPEWGMYVTPDDPLRDTPEKAKAYYTNLFDTFPQLAAAFSADVVKASDEDLRAAAELLGA